MMSVARTPRRTFYPRRVLCTSVREEGAPYPFRLRQVHDTACQELMIRNHCLERQRVRSGRLVVGCCAGLLSLPADIGVSACWKSCGKTRTYASGEYRRPKGPCWRRISWLERPLRLFSILGIIGPKRNASGRLRPGTPYEAGSVYAEAAFVDEVLPECRFLDHECAQVFPPEPYWFDFHCLHAR